MLLPLHVALSALGIVTGLLSLAAILSGMFRAGWTAIFLATTALTSITGFSLPPFGLDPARVVGALSLILLVLASIGLYRFRLAGSWRWIYLVTATAALFLNCFVAVVQSFQKVPALRALAPTQSEPPFVIAVGALLLVSVLCGFFAVRRFRPALQ